MLFIDATSAHLEADCDREHTYAELPDEDASEGLLRNIEEAVVPNDG